MVFCTVRAQKAAKSQEQQLLWHQTSLSRTIRGMSILSYIFVMQMGCCHVQAAFNFLLEPTIVFCICTHQNILSTSRNTQRIIHIPFYPPRESPSPTLQVENEMKMRAARTMASASMGHIISLGKELVSADRQQHINANILPFVCKHLPTVHYRVQKCYALMLAVAELVSVRKTGLVLLVRISTWILLLLLWNTLKVVFIFHFLWL